jgi:hypothetical protein
MGNVEHLLGPEEWIVSHNRLEYRYGSKSTVPRKSRSYVNGTFELQRVKDEGHVYWELGFKGSKGWTDRGVLWRQIGVHVAHRNNCKIWQLY